MQLSFLIFCILASFYASALETVTATVDRNPAVINQSLVLTVVADDSVSADALDLSSLEKDFIVGNTQVSSQTSMVNFNTTRITKWTTVLIPKRVEQLIIPALTIQGVKSQPIAMQILAENDSRAKQQTQLISLDAEVSADEVYVQQQFTLKVKLFILAELRRANLSDPKMTGADIQKIGQDEESIEVINGKRVRVIERNYKVKPETSGKFTLHSPHFNGEVSQSSGRRSLFSSMEQGKPITVRGKEIAINVKPIPEGFTGEWLPSELLTVNEQMPEGEEFELGEPITRKIIITAAGLTAEQLPELDFNAPDGLKIYPDQAEDASTIRNGTLFGQKNQDFAIVPIKPGTYTLPEVIIPWWNTKFDRLEQAVIPAKTITITGIAAQTPIVSQQLPSEPVIVTEYNTTLQWLFLTLWLLTSASWFYVAKLKGRIHLSKDSFVSEDKQSYLKLMAACKQNDGEQVIALLPKWANDLFDSEHFANLDQLRTKFNDAEFNSALAKLQKSYYANEKNQWHGDDMLKIISRMQTRVVQQQQVEIALNP